MTNKKTKLIAYFLPGFHEDQYNNQWWGNGFTEWENVRRAKALYDGHNQPKMPMGGFYDLSDARVLHESFRKSQEFGVYGFAIYDYWYDGKRPLGAVLDTLLKHPEIEGKFSICWANHSWNRSWINRAGGLDVLIEQTYGDKGGRKKHFEHLCKVYSDKRYIKYRGKPFFQIYQPSQVSNFEIYIDELRNFASKEGFQDIHISGVVNRWHGNLSFLKSLDSVTLGNPTLAMFGPDNVFSNIPQAKHSKLLDAYARALPVGIKKYIYRLHDMLPEKYTTFTYESLLERMYVQARTIKQSSSKKVFLSAFTGFDNTPRYKKRAKIITDSNPELFHSSLLKLDTITDPDDLIFINAWNEWGEGMFLEECAEFKDRYLRVINQFMQAN